MGTGGTGLVVIKIEEKEKEKAMQKQSTVNGNWWDWFGRH